MSDMDQGAKTVAGAGAMLRNAREAAGVHLSSLAAALKVPVARLEALEAERFDLLPDPPFVRALAGSVCRALKLDPVPVLALLPQKGPLRLSPTVQRTDGATFRTRSAPSAGLAGIGHGLRHPVFWVVVVLLLAAAGLMLVPSERLGAWVHALTGSHVVDTAQQPVGGVSDATASASATPSDPPVAAVAPMGPESTRTDNAAGAEPGLPPALTATPSLPAAPAVPVVPATASTASTAATAATAATPAVAAAAAAPTEGLLIFNASAQSWVRVTDSHGATVFEKTLSAGASQVANGTPPLNVVIGNAGATTVQLRGQAFDLTAITRNNVARFEVR